jgi:hypothetical protein
MGDVDPQRGEVERELLEKSSNRSCLCWVEAKTYMLVCVNFTEIPWKSPWGKLDEYKR